MKLEHRAVIHVLRSTEAMRQMSSEPLRLYPQRWPYQLHAVGAPRFTRRVAHSTMRIFDGGASPR